MTVFQPNFSCTYHNKFCFYLFSESGIVADIDSPVTSPVKEDAFTQTTLKRPVKKDSNKDDDTLSSASSSPHQSSKHSDSSHRLSLVELSMEDLDTVVWE